MRTFTQSRVSKVESMNALHMSRWKISPSSSQRTKVEESINQICPLPGGDVFPLVRSLNWIARRESRARVQSPVYPPQLLCPLSPEITADPAADSRLVIIIAPSRRLALCACRVTFFLLRPNVSVAGLRLGGWNECHVFVGGKGLNSPAWLLRIRGNNRWGCWKGSICASGFFFCFFQGQWLIVWGKWFLVTIVTEFFLTVVG